ncbi:MAG: hypothetical protein ACOY3Z_12695 [Thermodesulfobacteriota bacterium]
MPAMKHLRPLLLPALLALASFSAPTAQADTGGSAAACAAMSESFMNAYNTFQHNREATLNYFRQIIQSARKALEEEQRQLDDQQAKMAMVRQQLETLREATVKGGSGQAAVDRYNEMIRESNSLRQGFDRWTERYQVLLADYNQLVALYNEVAANPERQGCGDYLPKVASFRIAGLVKFDTNQALTLCAEENQSIDTLNLARRDIETSPCEGLIASLPRFERPIRSDLHFLAAPPSPNGDQPPAKPAQNTPNIYYGPNRPPSGGP